MENTTAQSTTQETATKENVINEILSTISTDPNCCGGHGDGGGH